MTKGFKYLVTYVTTLGNSLASQIGVNCGDYQEVRKLISYIQNLALIPNWF